MDNMQNSTIPVVFGTDESYIFPTAVVISSILRHSKSSTVYDIFIVTDNECISKCKNFFDRLKKQYTNFHITYLQIDSSMFRDANVTNPHVKLPTYYRLLTAELLPHYDKCICLDSDILVNQDLTELFRFNMGDNCIAGVKSWDDQQPTAANRKHMMDDGLPSMDQYIYLGVLLMNLKKIRKENLTKTFMEHMYKGYRADDQDVFNVCCYNKIAFLPPKYNLLVRFYDIKMLDGKEIYKKEELENNQKNPVILHYPGRLIKPWLNKRVKDFEKWWKSAEIYEGTNDYKYYRKLSQYWIKEIDWTELLKKVSNKERVVLFGYSEIGKEVFWAFKRAGINSVYAFCDNDPKKQGGFFEGLPVLDVSEFLKWDFPFKIVITSQIYFPKIKKQLLEMGIPENNILIYSNKSLIYYRSISGKYYEKEFEELCYKEYGDICNLKNVGYAKMLEKLKCGEDEEMQKLKEKYQLDKWLLS